MDARATYTQGLENRGLDVRAHEARSRTIGILRLAVFVGTVALLGVIVWAHPGSWAWGALGALLVAFAALVVIHARVIARKERAITALRFHERGLARLDGKWTTFAHDGERFRSADHPFADDLDVFGPASLFQLIDATETRFGEERLAGLLARTTPDEWPTAAEQRQAAVRDLAPRAAFRERISSLGALLAAEKPDPRPFLEWAEGALPLPAGAMSLKWVARILPAFAVGFLVVWSNFPWAKIAFGVTVLVEFALIGAFRARIGKIAEMVLVREAGLTRYGELFAALEAEEFEAPLLKDLKARLLATGHSATGEMRAFAAILGFLEARENGVFRLFIGPVLLWELNCVLALEKWRARTGKRARAWFDVLGEIEALSSLSTLAFERPEYAWPTLTTAATFDATGLGHPLISNAARVDNDVAVSAAGKGLIVTGSNMSGKSTLLRAIGINSVLALAGGPVCAKALKIGPLRIATSMRIKDSLEQGVSHFYAELQKLKRVIDMSRDGGPTVMFLLDEILHGTNSRERILGARAIIRELLSRGAMGAVSTHDLGISDLEAELSSTNGGPAVKNVHFEEQVEGEKMTFDYRLREGIVKSSNALRLMKLVGIDVVPN